MYIAPGTAVRLLRNIPLDSTYNHTIYFGSRSAQTSYFSSMAKYSLNDYTYQRVKRGVIRVGIVADNLYDCNYVMFQNSNFGSKWFYAFIKSVEYVNNETSDVTFELDVIQSWFFEFSLQQCFVEREHSSSDKPGDNILPEPVELGEYVYNTYEKLGKELEPMAVIMAAAETGGEDTSGGMIDGVYSGTKITAFNSSDVEGINTAIKGFMQSPDSIVSMYMCPVICTGGAIEDGGTIISGAGEGHATGWSHTYTLDGVGTGLNGYIPRNKKLLTYPYCFLHVDNGSGQSAQYRFEFFEGGIPQLHLDSTVIAPVKITCRPRRYKGSSGVNHTETVTLENYPQCSWNMDAYKVWLAQNMAPMVMKTVSGVTTSALSAGKALVNAKTGNLAGAAQGLADSQGAMQQVQENIQAFMMDSYTASIQADLCRGNVNNGSINMSHQYQNFYIGRAAITMNYARAIDDFFTVFGYATKRVKVPNRTARPHFNYVKTAGCVVTGSVPVDDMNKICQIHDAGITYWKEPGNVGNYSLDNSI